MSFNISMDYVDPNQDLYGYNTRNLNNCFQDESFLREVTKTVVSAIVADGSLFQMAGFADAIKNCSEEDLAQLKKIIGQA